MQHQIIKSTPEESDLIDDWLYEWNREVLDSKEKSDTKLNYVVKHDNQVIAGINAFFYWNMLFIDSLFVVKEYRGNKIGSELIDLVEAKAKELGAKLAHLDTFDWQGKDFYLKHGYKVFGVLDDCPKWHKRYYLSKFL
jgi:GNAT superfamily N-acetyltransferase